MKSSKVGPSIESSVAVFFSNFPALLLNSFIWGNTGHWAMSEVVCFPALWDTFFQIYSNFCLYTFQILKRIHAKPTNFIPCPNI